MDKKNDMEKNNMNDKHRHVGRPTNEEKAQEAKNKGQDTKEHRGRPKKEETKTQQKKAS